jgi:hypothetical protein
MLGRSHNEFMAKYRTVWVIHWTHSEYGGPKNYQGPSYHITLEDAEAYKKQREGPWAERSERFFKDGYEYIGTEPKEERVSEAEFKRIKG